MIILNIDKLSKNFGYGVLFENLSFSLNEGESISIVGPNGCGKSTILKIIAGIEKADTGSVSIKKNTTVAYLDQSASDKDDNRLVIDIFKSAFTKLNELQDKINTLQAKLSQELSEEEANNTLIKYCNLVEEFSKQGGYDIEVTINTIIEGLRINKEIINQPYNKLSGGEKTLVQLAKSLMAKPNLFLLDEPTNHLDIERIEWLENYIKSFKGATVVVSHDRYFLDKMSNKILSLESGEPKIYVGNYTQYLEQRERDFEKLLNLYKDQQQVIKRFESQIKYFSEMGMAKNSSTLCDRAHSLQTQLDRIKKNAIQKPKTLRKLNISFDAQRKSSKRIIESKNLCVETPTGRKILNNTNLYIHSGDRVAIIGSNGSGKSTFIKTIMQTNNLPYTGEFFVGPSVKIGYLPQTIHFENENMNILEYFIEEISQPEKIARQILAEFQFYKDDVLKKVKNLSGGEKIRLKLASLLQQKINTLIFDEPTNHIDIPTKEVLEDALENFDGTLIFVSHDRYFINKFADKTIEFKDGNATTFVGNYDYYKSQKNKI